MDYWGGGGQRVCWPPSQIIGGGPTPMNITLFLEKRQGVIIRAGLFGRINTVK